MAKEFFKAHFFPEQYGRKAWFTNSLNYYLAVTVLQRVPAPAAGNRHAADAALHRRAGWRRLLGADLPGGTPDGGREIGGFQPGIGMIAARLGVPVVPVRLEGLDRILHHTWKFPVRGPGSCAFGAPICR